MPSLVALTFYVVAAFTSLAQSASYLRAGEVSKEQLEQNLLNEVAEAVRPKASGRRIPRLEAALKLLFNVVPQESDGTLSHHAVRYVLHRFFVQKHGWFVRGLEPDGDSRDDAPEASHALNDLQEWVPSYLQRFLEQLSRGKGMSLRELAIFAASLEDLIHKEAAERLEMAWNAIGFAPSQNIEVREVQKLLEVYMMIYNLGGDIVADNPAQVEEELNSFINDTKDWNATQKLIQNVRNKVFPIRDGRTMLNFNQTAQLVEELGENFAVFNDKDCGQLRSVLLGIESQKPGRIRLSEFYKKQLASDVFSFNEKQEYLRSLGALDESDPNVPYLIVPNYVASRPNCLVSSNFYVVCCRNECEDLMTSVESATNKSSASPDEILRIVTGLSSSSVKAPRSMSAALVSRLSEMADFSGGEVHLHGRLFAQWMHHAFPRECPYPHEAGTTSPQTPDEWMKGSGEKTHRLTDEEIKEHVQNCKAPIDGENLDLPWSHTEELYFNPRTQTGASTRPLRRMIAMLGLLSSMAYWMLSSWRSLMRSSRKVCLDDAHYA